MPEIVSETIQAGRLVEQIGQIGDTRLLVMASLLIAAATAAALTGACGAEASPPVAVEGGVRFSYEAPDATSVHLAGEFNSWSPTALAMLDEDGDGVWEVVTELQTGRSYEYKFVIDGNWTTDETAEAFTDD